MYCRNLETLIDQNFELFKVTDKTPIFGHSPPCMLTPEIVM